MRPSPEIVKEVESREHFRLRVRNASGHTLEFEVHPKETVAEFKRRLESADGTHVRDQRLLCRSVLMADERTLGSYGLCEHSIILCLHKLHAVAAGGKRDKAHSAKRGFLMVPGCGDPWLPKTAGRVSALEAVAHFDGSNLPAPWKISSGQTI
eukprot:CAMPEP_0117505744 /NCGR_PEP_ID=MMETSP0784-20121206/25542_1 /TAXON_ID=39447 /ORGANISM="" /LENGTH=152 /DNA_ID=CAMNT_0005301179 /DNA_START=127 /DNA_END=585 /DNA_ORIENTATION=+